MRVWNYKGHSENGKKNTSWIECPGGGDYGRQIKKKKKARELEMSLVFTIDRCVGSSNNKIETFPEVYWVSNDD